MRNCPTLEVYIYRLKNVSVETLKKIASNFLVSHGQVTYLPSLTKPAIQEICDLIAPRIKKIRAGLRRERRERNCPALEKVKIYLRRLIIYRRFLKKTTKLYSILLTFQILRSLSIKLL